MSPDRAMRVALIADTHMPRHGDRLPDVCVALMASCDLVVHAGDHSTMAAHHALQMIGPPVVAVHGNVEEPTLVAVLPATAEVEVAGVRVGVIHDAGPERGRPARMAARFPGVDVVVFGHSHIPLDQDAPEGPRLVNPGSPTDRRRQPHHTMAVMTVASGRVMAVDFHVVDDPPGPLDPELVRR